MILFPSSLIVRLGVFSAWHGHSALYFPCPVFFTLSSAFNMFCRLIYATHRAFYFQFLFQVGLQSITCLVHGGKIRRANFRFFKCFSNRFQHVFCCLPVSLAISKDDIVFTGFNPRACGRRDRIILIR